MKFPRMIAVLGLTCALLLSGCGSEETSSLSELMASKKNGTQQSPLTKMPEHMKDMYGMGETSDSALENETYSTLKEEIGDYNGCSLRYPNFEELSVGMLYKGEVHKYCLFDKEGRVHCIFDDDVNIVSGFYNGMCLTSTGVMAKEDDTFFRPTYLSDDETIVRYAKDDDGVLLWTVKREDSIKGTTAILTAWDANGEIRFQCDTTRDEFSEMNPDTVYNDLSQNQYESIGISQAFAYCGGSVYRIRSDLYYVFMNIDTGKFFSVREPNAYLVQVEGNQMIRTQPGLRALDGDFNELPEWKAIKSRRSGTPVLSEGLLYLDVRRDADDFEDYPSGFYDVHLNRIIDLSEYDVRPINENSEPRFMNGYAVLQLRNPDGVLFWGVMDKNGNWTSQPQKGTIKYVFPTADGVLISTCEENTDMYQTYNQNGAKLQNWDGLQFNGYYGYADKKPTYGSYEVYDGFLYTDLSGHIAKISSGGTFEMLS